ncbi:hypothetical protein [Dyella psychrodurans]|uniref:hypothetical protein n=1 Tax=Dyella psychrodurans TaxID=1927960 RepID=UPI0011C02B6D|nr:hypothetical protein [Dyella psychrodurans]
MQSNQPRRQYSHTIPKPDIITPTAMASGDRTVADCEQGKTTPLYEAIEERYFSAHHMLLRAAGEALYEAQRIGPVSLREERLLTSMVMSSLAIEALCNAVGYRVVPGWEDYEQISPWAKIRLLCTTLGIYYDRGAHPWQRLRSLLNFRNQIAHGKPEHVRTRRVLTSQELDAVMSNNAMNQPSSKFEANLTAENARIAFATVREIEGLLTENITQELKLGITVEGWTHRSRQLSESEVSAEVINSATPPTKSGSSIL